MTAREQHDALNHVGAEAVNVGVENLVCEGCRTGSHCNGKDANCQCPKHPRGYCDSPGGAFVPWVLACQQHHVMTECVNRQAAIDTLNVAHGDCKPVWMVGPGDTLRDGTRVR